MRPRSRRAAPLLTIVVPVFNGGPEIVENVGHIRRAAAGSLAPEDVEVVVVSDGSIDGTAERLLEARSDVDMRVIHYDRNLGKGYAVKLGALAAHGTWVALVGADLDLDPRRCRRSWRRRGARGSTSRSAPSATLTPWSTTRGRVA